MYLDIMKILLIGVRGSLLTATGNGTCSASTAADINTNEVNAVEDPRSNREHESDGEEHYHLRGSKIRARMWAGNWRKLQRVKSLLKDGSIRAGSLMKGQILKTYVGSEKRPENSVEVKHKKRIHQTRLGEVGTQLPIESEKQMFGRMNGGLFVVKTNGDEMGIRDKGGAVVQSEGGTMERGSIKMEEVCKENRRATRRNPFSLSHDVRPSEDRVKRAVVRRAHIAKRGIRQTECNARGEYEEKGY
ncbi:hypothetical protein C8J57DRAFT_1245493 [Mycena rebaudengoi]|nr:hypothetical protein C8J57DRAFT_1245493 [Mycena rebaudengoi]